MNAVRPGLLVASAVAIAAACTSFSAGTATTPPRPLDAAPSSHLDAEDTTCVDSGLVTLDASLGAAGDLDAFVAATDGIPPPLVYPSIEPDAGTALLPSADGGVQSARSAIWFSTPVPLVAFDVSFELLVSCVPDAGGCGDGLAFAWVDASSVDAALAGGASAGNSLGIPWNVGGSAVAADLFSNPNTNDPPTPALEILALDGSAPAGSYPWLVRAAAQPSLAAPAWNPIRISVRGGHARVTFGTTPLEADVGPLTRGVFGITAATGTSSAGFNIRNLQASFSACPLPP